MIVYMRDGVVQTRLRWMWRNFLFDFISLEVKKKPHFSRIKKHQNVFIYYIHLYLLMMDLTSFNANDEFNAKYTVQFTCDDARRTIQTVEKWIHHLQITYTSTQTSYNRKTEAIKSGEGNTRDECIEWKEYRLNI